MIHSDPDCFHQGLCLSTARVKPTVTGEKTISSNHVLNLVFATNPLKFVQRNGLKDCFVHEHHVASLLN